MVCFGKGGPPVTPLKDLSLPKLLGHAKAFYFGLSKWSRQLRPECLTSLSEIPAGLRHRPAPDMMNGGDDDDDDDHADCGDDDDDCNEDGEDGEDEKDDREDHDHDVLLMAKLLMLMAMFLMTRTPSAHDAQLRDDGGHC